MNNSDVEIVTEEIPQNPFGDTPGYHNYSYFQSLDALKRRDDVDLNIQLQYDDDLDNTIN